KILFQRESSDLSDSDEDGVVIKTKAPLITPFEALHHLEKIKEKIGKRDHTMKHAIASYCAEVEADGNKELHYSLNKYLNAAIQPSKLAFSTGSAMMTEFLNSPAALKYLPGFPHKPKNTLFCYAAHKEIANGLGMLKIAAERIKSDDKGRIKAEKEAEKSKVEYIVNLQSFLDKNEKNLSEAQKKNLEATLIRFDKAMHPEKYVKEKKEKKEKTPGKRKRKETKTAFEHFVGLSDKLYTEYEPEKRMKKLQKKFDKLEPAVREVYEKLAIRD
ncbi:hypothetical protein PFISCL1PPCAC_19003, partial [Pristionchus fissidentatus]